MKLNTEKIYDLEDLTSEELEEVLSYLKKNDKDWDEIRIEDFSSQLDEYKLRYCGSEWGWTKENQTTNAKELFYTLENIQVDCSELTEDRIDDMFELVTNKGFQTRIDALTTKGQFVFFRKEITGNKFGLFEEVSERTTITYEKFMELFGEPQYEVKMIVEAPKPKHYAKGIDTFARMEANCTKEECLAFAKGNIDKYNFRTKGQDLEDYKKIVSYANWAIKLLKDEN